MVRADADLIKIKINTVNCPHSSLPMFKIHPPWVSLKPTDVQQAGVKLLLSERIWPSSALGAFSSFTSGCTAQGRAGGVREVKLWASPCIIPQHSLWASVIVNIPFLYKPATSSSFQRMYLGTVYSSFLLYEGKLPKKVSILLARRLLNSEMSLTLEKRMGVERRKSIVGAHKPQQNSWALQLQRCIFSFMSQRWTTTQVLAAKDNCSIEHLISKGTWST